MDTRPEGVDDPREGRMDTNRPGAYSKVDPRNPSPENFTISIVDDDASLRRALLRLMDSAGLAAECFASAQEFLASPSLAKTSCLILDVAMPGMDGLELQRRLAASDCKVPIIFISAHADEGIRAMALAAGAADFFAKPFSDDALLEAVARVTLAGQTR